MESPSLHEQKKALRQEINALKQQYSASDLKSFSLPIITEMLSFDSVKEADCIMLYNSMPDEVDTRQAIEQLYEHGKKILLPVVVSKTEMEIREYTGPDNMKIGPYHIPEPIGKTYTAYPEIDVIIVPGVAFDRQGNRMGHGRGYYDRFFSHIPGTLKIGICFPFQLVPTVPADVFDVKMDYIITGNGTSSGCIPTNPNVK